MAAPPPPSWREQQWIAAPPAASYADVTAPDASTGGSSGALYAGGARGDGNANGAGQEPSQAAPPPFRMPRRKGQELCVDTSQQQLYEPLRQQTAIQHSQEAATMPPTAAVTQAQQQQQLLMHAQMQQLYQQPQHQQQQWNAPVRMEAYPGKLSMNYQQHIQQVQGQQEQEQIQIQDQQQQQQRWGVSPSTGCRQQNQQQNQQQNRQLLAQQLHAQRVQQQQQQQQQWDAPMRMDVYTQNTQQQQVQQQVEQIQVQTKQRKVQTQPQRVQQQQQFRRPYQFLESEIRDSASTGSGSDSGGAQRSTAVIQPGDAIVPQQYRDQIQIELPIPPQLGPPSFNLLFSHSYGGSGYSGHSYGGYPGSEYAGGGVQNNMMSNQRSPVTASSAPPVTFVPYGVVSDGWPMPDPFNGYSNNSGSDTYSVPVDNQFGKTTWNREQHFSAAASAINPSFNNANASSSNVFGRSQNLLSAPHQNQNQRQQSKQQQQQQQRQQLQNQQNSAARAAAETLYALHSPVFSPARNEVNFGTHGSNSWGQVQSTGVTENLKKASPEFRLNRLTQLLNMTVEQQNYELSVAANASVGDDFLNVLVGRSQPGGYDSKIATGDANQSVPHQSPSLQQPQKSLTQPTTGYQLSNGHIEATGFRGAMGVPSHAQHLSANVLSKEMKKKTPVKRKKVKDAAVHENRVQLPMLALIHSDSVADEWVVPAPEPKKKGISRPQPAPAYRMTSSTPNLHKMKPPTASVLPANAAVKKKTPVKRRKKQDIAMQESKPQEPITVSAAQKPKPGTVIASTFSVPSFARIPGLGLGNDNFAAAMPTPNALRNLMNPVEDASDSGTATERPDQGLVPPSSNLGNLPLLGSQSLFQPGGALQRLWEEKTIEKVTVPPKQPKAKQPKAQRRNAQGAPTEKRSRKRKNEAAASNGVHVALIKGTNTHAESNAPSSKSKVPQCAGGRKIRVVSKQITGALMAEINFSYSNHVVAPEAKSGSTSSVSILPSKNASNPANASAIIANNAIEKEVANGSRPLPGTWTKRGLVQAQVAKPDEINVADLAVGGESSTPRTPAPITPKPRAPRVNESKEPVPPTAAVGMVGSTTQESAGDAPDQVQVASSEGLGQPNNTIMIFCKRDFMRYQAAKLWKKYQDKKKKMEFQSVQVLGKRTRYVNARYEEEQAQAHAQAQKKAKAPKKKTRKAKPAGKSGSARSNDSSLPEQAKKSREDAQDLAATRAEQAQRDEVSSTDQTSNNESLLADQTHAQPNKMKLSEITPTNGIGSVEEPPSNDLTPVEHVWSAVPDAETPAVTPLEQALSSGSVSTKHTPDKKVTALEQNPRNEEERFDQVSSMLTDALQVNDASPVEEASASGEMAVAEQAPIVAVTRLSEPTASEETKPISQASSSEVECIEQTPSPLHTVENSIGMTTSTERVSTSVAKSTKQSLTSEAARRVQASSSEANPAVDAMATIQPLAAPSVEAAPDVQDSRSAEIPTMEGVSATRTTDDVASVEQGVSAMPVTDAPRIGEIPLEHDSADELMPTKKAPLIMVTPPAEIPTQEMAPMEQESTPSNAAVEFIERTPRNEMAPAEHDLDAAPDAEALSATEREEVQSVTPALLEAAASGEMKPSNETLSNEVECVERTPTKRVTPVAEASFDVVISAEPFSIYEAKPTEHVPINETARDVQVSSAPRDEIWPIKQVPTSFAQIASALSNKWTLFGHIPRATSP